MDMKHETAIIKEEPSEGIVIKEEPLEGIVIKDEPSEGMVIKEEPSGGMEYIVADDQIFNQISELQNVQPNECCDLFIGIKTEIAIKEENFDFGMEDDKNSETFQQKFEMNEWKDLLEECHTNGNSFQRKRSLRSGHQGLRRENKGTKNLDRKDLSSNYNSVSEDEEKLISHLESFEEKVKYSRCNSESNFQGNTNQSISKTKLFESSECNKKGHLNGKIKFFKCLNCSYQSKYKGNIKTHIMKHQNTKLFKCSECNYECNQKGNLNRHMVKHEGRKLYKCSECNYECNRKGNLKQHMSIHREPKFKCSDCSYEGNKKMCLQRHMLKHRIPPEFAHIFETGGAFKIRF